MQRIGHIFNSENRIGCNFVLKSSSAPSGRTHRFPTQYHTCGDLLRRHLISTLTAFFLLAFLFILPATNTAAQELKCEVAVNADKVPGSNKQVFTTMQKAILEFVNHTRWSDMHYQSSEKIECNMLITIDEMTDEKTFKANLQIQARRPVYNSSYYSSLLNFKDPNFNFEYIEHQTIDYIEGQTNDELVSLLAYYCYMIIGMDCDSYSDVGGTPSFRKMETVVNLEQSKGLVGWKAFDDLRNRYAYSNNLNDENLKNFRHASYLYHRLGLDQMASSTDKGCAKVLEALREIKKSYDIKSSCVAITSFMETKRDELINIFSHATDNQKKEAYDLLISIEPSQSDKYETILKKN